MDNASTGGPTVDVFNQAFQDKYGISSDGPGIHTQYDAVIVLGLAMTSLPS